MTRQYEAVIRVSEQNENTLRDLSNAPLKFDDQSDIAHTIGLNDMAISSSDSTEMQVMQIKTLLAAAIIQMETNRQHMSSFRKTLALAKIIRDIEKAALDFELLTFESNTTT